MKIIFIIGARPNYMKAIPLYHKLKNVIIIHTMQHYDSNMNTILKNIPVIYLEKNNTMCQLVKYFKLIKPKLVIVFGDVNSTLIGAIVTKKMDIKLAHIEAGLRSFTDIPEETNRIIVDHLSDYHFVTEPSAILNLKNEGITKNIFYVGNLMIDSLINVKISLPIYENYIVLTLHRPSNVDNKQKYQKIIKFMDNYNVIFPIHHRSVKYLPKTKNMKIINPLPYNKFISLINHSKLVITDSGGIQEETSYMGIPCITLRKSTERPITIIKGTNHLMEFDEKILKNKIDELYGKRYQTKINKWDGKTADRIVDILYKNILI